jgi:hypothetical protein
VAYLNFAEYSEYGLSEVSEMDFGDLLKRASRAIDFVTNNYYIRFDLADDVVNLRRLKFKEAIACQIDYLQTTGILSAEDKATLTGQTIGSVSVSYVTNTEGKTKSNVCQDALNLLQSVGLLYRGDVNVR